MSIIPEAQEVEAEELHVQSQSLQLNEALSKLARPCLKR